MVARALIFSQRRIADLVAYCLAYEFEDVIAEVTGAERIDARDFAGLEFSRRAYKIAHLALLGSAKYARRIAPYPRNSIRLERDYDQFFPVFSHIYELYALAMLPNWRERCGRACCFVTEAWHDMLPAYLLELLAEFDHVFIGSRNAVKDVTRLTGRPCSYLPLAVDVLRFTPASPDEPRPIAVCNIGRRSQVTHRALLAEADRLQIFYYYDTVAASGDNLTNRTFRIDNPSEHRRMLASVLKRSRFFFANRSYVNRPDFRARGEELSSRFYEGAAAGTVMIGEAPRTDAFRRQFDWPDAVIHVPFDSPDIVEILANLDGNPERLRAARLNNLSEAARRHDWLHRLQVVFDTLDIAPTEAMRARARRLDQVAARAVVA